MSKKKSDEPTKSKSKKSSKKAFAETALEGMAAAPVQSSAQPKPGRSVDGKKKTAAQPDISSDEIARRAYYIAERRRKLSLPGDELSDWIEAEKQLRKEGSKKSR